MASRRAPLADVPNAINSPLRFAPTASGKRTRAQAGEHRDAILGQPPAKKQIVEDQNHARENVEPTRRTGIVISARDRIDEPFAKRITTAPPTAFERKLAAVREKKPLTLPKPKPPVEKPQNENIESVRQWQRHYRKQFPQFVFYFDNVPDDVRTKAVRQIYSLGAREEKFFSKAVTHVVTTRSIPTEAPSAVADEDLKDGSILARTVHPSVLTNDHRRTTGLLADQSQRRGPAVAASSRLNVDSRKTSSQVNDILSRARSLGIKIWALEKLQRVLSTILDTETGEGAALDPRTQTNSRHVAKPVQDARLEQMLRNEKVNGPADRDMTVATQDMITLRGCYLYVHDMDERTKPTMAREYSKPSNREDGKWPQFRLTPAGRCPFIEDPAYKKKIQQREEEGHAKADHVHKGNASIAVSQRANLQPLADREPNVRRSPRKMPLDCKVNGTHALDASNAVPTKRQSSFDTMPPMFGSTQVNLRGLPRMVAGEPVASGVQPSNVTSAIRSQIISSAAISSTAPGLNRRVGDTKEVSMLKRKVLERGPSSYMNDVRAAINDDKGPPPRAAKRKAQETLGVVHEDDDGRMTQHDHLAKKKRVIEREPKAGYCENCRDKFDDFDEHILTRKHRKFALTQDNWTELDDLLRLLKRPHKIT